MADIAKSLGLDNTFYYIFSTFIVFYTILSVVYLKPFMNMLLKRRETLSQIKSAENVFKSLDEKISKIEAELHQARLESSKAFEAASTNAQREEDALLSELRDELKKEYLNLSTQLSEEKKQTQQQLEASIDQMATELSNKIMSAK